MLFKLAPDELAITLWNSEADELSIPAPVPASTATKGTKFQNYHKKIITNKFRVQIGEKVDLGSRSTKVKPLFESKKEYHQILDCHVNELSGLQRLHYSSDRYSILLTFQGMDASGKDGAIRHVMSGVNPQGCEVFSFQAAERRGIGSRFPLAREPPSAGARTDRDLQPLLFGDLVEIHLLPVAKRKLHACWCASPAMVTSNTMALNTPAERTMFFSYQLRPEPVFAGRSAP